jgi:hypothetical protein
VERKGCVRVGTKTAPPPSKDLKDGCRDIIFNRPVREFYLGICDRKLLYSGGRPTSLVLLLRVQVSELPLPLGSHPSLSLHDLLCLVGASGGLVALGGIEVVEVLALALALGALGPVEVERMGAGATAAAVGNSAAVWWPLVVHSDSPPQPATHRSRCLEGFGSQLTSAACYKALAGLLEVLVGTVDLVELVGEGIVILGLRSANTCRVDLSTWAVGVTIVENVPARTGVVAPWCSQLFWLADDAGHWGLS